MAGPISNTKKTTQQIAQQVARQMAQEPLEVLKDAGKQLIGSPEVSSHPNFEQPTQPTQQSGRDLKEHAQKLKQRDTRLLSALENEVKDIRKQELLKTLQQKIAAGDEVALQEYPELTDQERQYLETQIQMVVAQKQQQANQNTGIPLPASKPGRRMGAGQGQKAQAEKQQTRVEKPMPPSG